MQNIQKSILNMVMQKWLNSDYLIIDTETTGLDNNAEVIEIAIINMHGDVLLNSLVKPTCSIPAAVTKINNITDEMVADAPLWRDVFPVILNIIDGKKWLAWNSKFDARLIIQTGVITGYFEDLPASKILDIAAKINDSQIDAKAVYDQWYGEFDSKRNNFKRQSLATAAERHNVSVNGAHRALADCMMVLGVLNAVCHSDYAVFEARYAELVADNDKAMEAMKQALRERYSPKPVPECHICGKEMTIQHMSASRITYGCTGATYDDKGCHYAEGRSIADDHYEQSRVTVVDVSDPDVLALLDELEKEKGYASTYEAEKWHYHGLAESEGERADRAEKQVDELTMWVKRLACSLKKARPSSKLYGAAMDYLSRKGLISVEDVLR
ncbi:ead/Ea22-like family protein [Salmonella enterica]|nr:ead/Ea22-like family protein [Salmonella enterica]